MAHAVLRGIRSGILPFLVLFSAGIPTASAQQILKFSGLLYADYSYTVESAGGDADGANAFGYRRVYLTADYALSDRFVGRLRFESNDKTTNSAGKPSPFVKDLYVKWKSALGKGHDLTFGVSPPPSFSISEKFWGYRSLLKTLMDRAKIVSSRDTGIALRGPLSASGKVRYGVMVANNSSVSKETNKDKRVYGQIELYPSKRFQFTIGGDYASLEDGSVYTLNVFGGYTGDRFRFGVEGFASPRSFDHASDTETRYGATGFLIARVSEKTRAVVRFDYTEKDFAGSTSDDIFGLIGLSFSPEKNVEIIPNILIEESSTFDNREVTGRLTLYVKFK